jgi:DNA (cytosine-5)-methyltransferase 1
LYERRCIVKKPRLLDLFSGAGGISQGYYMAGFEVVGVDNVPQPSYPFEFHLADAMTFPLDGFDVVVASPPCPSYSLATGFHPEARVRHPRLVEEVRARLEASSLPYVIENVPGSPVVKSIMLCGAMFKLRTYRHRYFESNIFLFQPHHPKHIVKAAGPGAIAKDNEFWSIGGHFGQKDEAQKAMGISWMKRTKEIANAIPPAYSHYIGLQLINALGIEVAS